MTITTGIDLVYLPRFKKALKKGSENFLRRVFTERELAEPIDIKHLAGIFAAKEAIIKALSLLPDSWLNIHITHSLNGAPQAKIFYSKFFILNSSLSISHDGDYAIAQYVALVKKGQK